MKTLYFMPFLSIDDNVLEIEGIRFVKNTGQYQNVMPEIFNKYHNGVFLELTGSFVSYNSYNTNINLKILNAIEVIKFSYYALNAGSYGYFFSESSFELFTIIEQNKDETIKHKISITNGIKEYLFDLDKYYIHKSIFGENNQIIPISKNILVDIDRFYKTCMNNETYLRIIMLYNKCLRITDMNDCFDKIIFARASIDTMTKIKNINKKMYVEEFLKKSMEVVSKKSESLNRHIKEFYDSFLKSDNDLSHKNLNNYLKDLATARCDLVHENKVNSNFATIEAYIVWFPLFFIIEFFEKDIKKQSITQIILFLKLLHLDISEWNPKNKKHSDYNKLAPIEAYYQYAKFLNNNKDITEACINGFNDFFTS